MRDFDFDSALWAVVKNNGEYAGVPCTSYEEARDLAAQHKGARIFFLAYEPDEDDEPDEPDDIDSDEGFDSYAGCFTYDC